jgi:hypothetical protein
MDQCKLAIAMMAVTDSHWGPRDAHGRRRAFTADELDALADVGWHLPDLKGVLAACVRAVRVRVRPQPSHRIKPTMVPSATAPSHG